jgi:hypothetical protein
MSAALSGKSEILPQSRLRQVNRDNADFPFPHTVSSARTKAQYEGKQQWQECRWYTSLPVRGDKHFYGRWPWPGGRHSGNGQVENWFELLDSWYDMTNDQTGGVNGYRWRTRCQAAPASLASETLEELHGHHRKPHPFVALLGSP